ncbi:A24 family peptidase [Sphingomonas sp.]|uniref:prepilin peptidase n=1 Tax=Sphingomonas sp. TaxID=28214 RepID=UPI0033427BEA
MMTAMGWPVLLGVLGAVIGSFLATLVVRWGEERSVLRGRSQCDACHAPLRARDLIPLLSAAVARGRCRMCGARIDARHWQIELGCVFVGVLAGIAVPGPVGLAGAVFGWLLLTLAALDLAYFVLPNVVTTTLAVGGLATGWLGVEPSVQDRLIGGAGGFAVLWLIGEGYRLLRKRDGLGGGDPKMLGAIGLWLGWQILPVVVFLAALTGLALVLVGMATGKSTALTDAKPFGALLAIAAYPAWLFLLGPMA